MLIHYNYDIEYLENWELNKGKLLYIQLANIENGRDNFGTSMCPLQIAVGTAGVIGLKNPLSIVHLQTEKRSVNVLGRRREHCCSGQGEVLHCNLSNGSWVLNGMEGDEQVQHNSGISASVGGEWRAAFADFAAVMWIRQQSCNQSCQNRKLSSKMRMWHRKIFFSSVSLKMCLTKCKSSNLKLCLMQKMDRKK